MIIKFDHINEDMLQCSKYFSKTAIKYKCG